MAYFPRLRNYTRQNMSTSYSHGLPCVTSMSDYNGSNQFDLNQKPDRHNTFSFQQPSTFYSNSLMSEIPNEVHPYVTNIEDVERDENCGFRTITNKVRPPVFRFGIARKTSHIIDLFLSSSFIMIIRFKEMKYDDINSSFYEVVVLQLLNKCHGKINLLFLEKQILKTSFSNYANKMFKLFGINVFARDKDTSIKKSIFITLALVNVVNII
uniref:Uncharacterized protein n=1 Tax=Lactuca sativa TaxID=4236 RepID=A0A9R1XUU0_LACSA|nr:hypothetical protein LSAT_V11C100031690 [Lactuca sativa]